MDDYYEEENKKMLANCDKDLLARKLSEIEGIINKANRLFAELGNAEQEFCLNFHKENHSLNHCLRWGEQACEDLIAFSNESHVDYPKDNG